MIYNRPHPSMTDFSTIQQGLWDKFIDALDRAGQDGRIAYVEVPALAIDLPPGRQFGELTRADIDSLSKQALKVGRRADMITVMWEDMQRKKKPPRKNELHRRK
jgi:hypothetical protein